MRLSKKIYRSFQASDGRVKLATLSGIGLLAAALVLALAVLPAGAGEGGPSGAPVQPEEIAYGGGSGACSANFPGRLPSDAAYELHINNPHDGTFTGPDGTSVTINVYNRDKKFDFVINTPGMVALDVIVNGGSDNTHFDYDGNGGPGAMSSDTGLHAPTKGGGSNLYRLSHINLCYDEVPQVDLSISKSVEDPTPNEGDTVTYTVTVTNVAPTSNGTASGVTVTDTLPTGVTFVDTLGCAEDGTGVPTCTLGSIPEGGTASYDITATVDAGTAGTTLTNSASVDGIEPDPIGGNNSTSVDITVNSVDLSVIKAPQNAAPNAGQNVTFLIDVINATGSNASATNVTVTDTLPTGMTFVSASDGGTHNAGIVTWNLAALAKDATKQLTLVVAIAEGVGGQQLTNSVAVLGDETDPTPNGNDADSVPPVIVNAALSGTVFVDGNANSSFDTGESGEELTVTAYDDSGTAAGSTTSATDGTYSLELAPGTYRVCLQQRASHEQTVPDLPTEGIGTDDCDDLGTHELVGYGVALTSDVVGIDFGSLPVLVCEDLQTTSGTTISGGFEIFTNSNLTCGDKGHSLDVVDIEGQEAVAFLLDGAGEAAARGKIVKTEASPADFVPLTYSPAEDAEFVVLPWCAVREKVAGDGTQFDGDYAAGGTFTNPYPDLTGVYDDPGTNLIQSISCRVNQFEDSAGNQVTVVFGEFLDPFYR